jgi:hypothetical protein
MAGISEELRVWVGEVLSKHNITSSRQAENAVDGVLSYATLNNMMNGRKVSAQSIMLFARKFGLSPDKGLRACGYLGLSDEEEPAKAIVPSNVEDSEDQPLNPKDDLTYEPLSDEEGQVLRFYHGINPILRPKALAILKTLMDEDPDYEEGRVFGKKAE